MSSRQVHAPSVPEVPDHTMMMHGMMKTTVLHSKFESYHDQVKPKPQALQAAVATRCAISILYRFSKVRNAEITYHVGF